MARYRSVDNGGVMPPAARSPRRVTRCARLLRTRLIGATRSFGAMPALIHRTRRLACNAEVACARVGREGAALEAVTRELGGMGDELGVIMADLDSLFQDAAKDAARWVQAELRLHKYQGALDLLSSDGPRRWETDLGQTTGEAWTASAERADGNEAILWDHLIAARRDALDRLATLASFARHLRRALERIDLVAVKKSRFVGVLATIEAARMTTSEHDFETVSSSIRALGDEIANTASDAHTGVEEMTVLLEETLAPLRGALSKVTP
jgi:hypothetical protein